MRHKSEQEEKGRSPALAGGRSPLGAPRGPPRCRVVVLVAVLARSAVPTLPAAGVHDHDGVSGITERNEASAAYWHSPLEKQPQESSKLGQDFREMAQQIVGRAPRRINWFFSSSEIDIPEAILPGNVGSQVNVPFGPSHRYHSITKTKH